LLLIARGYPAALMIANYNPACVTNFVFR
jgi:hypothetical protein